MKDESGLTGSDSEGKDAGGYRARAEGLWGWRRGWLLKWDISIQAAPIQPPPHHTPLPCLPSGQLCSCIGPRREAGGGRGSVCASVCAAKLKFIAGLKRFLQWKSPL